MPKISFNNTHAPFFTTLKEKVNNYFEDNNIPKSGEKKLYTKSIIQTSSAIALYITLVFFTPGNFISILLSSLLGLNLATLGFNIMHEGGHQSLSRHKWINSIGAYFLNILGGNCYLWKIKHNINHHTYTNIQGMDSDIEIEPFMRIHKEQSLFWIHRFQHIYCIFLYGGSYLAWIFWDDFTKYFTGKFSEGFDRKMDLKEHFIFWITKVLYITLFICVPVFMVGLAKAIIGFAIMSFVCGLFIAMVFQLAHVVEGTSLPAPLSSNNKIEQEWAIHQLNTTANFSTNNKVISWFLGGLNFQVEHHLFPKISHVHYPKINKLIKETCEQYEVSYLEYSSIFKAIGSHFSHIKKMGRAY